MFKAVALLALAATLCSAGQTEEGLTREQGRQILDELQKIRQLLETQTAPRGGQGLIPTSVALDLDEAPSLGSASAPVTMVEFTDYECAFCQRFFQDAFPQIKRDYIDTGRVKFVVMDLPLAIHESALAAANAGRCAAEQGAFWPIHELMQANPQRLLMNDLAAYGASVGIDTGRFNDCMRANRYKDKIEKEVTAANAKGIMGTPTFVIGTSARQGFEGEVLLGASPALLNQKLKSLLERDNAAVTNSEKQRR